MLEYLSLDKLLEKYSLKDINNNPNIIIIDIRSADKFNHQHITGALNIPSCDLAKLSVNEYADKTAIFHCRSGQRTKMQAQLIEQAPCKQKYCLDGGLQAWEQAGLPTVSQTKAPIDIMRQVQIIAGSLILLGILLSFLNPWWLLLTVLVGAGLLFAGISGF